MPMDNNKMEGIVYILKNVTSFILLQKLESATKSIFEKNKVDRFIIDSWIILIWIIKYDTIYTC